MPSNKIAIDSSFHFDVKGGHYETKNSWAEVAIRKDKRRNDYYIDVLFGAKGQNKPHTHIGINGDQSLRFIEPRGVVHSIQKDVDSKFEGHLKTEKATFNDEPIKGTFTFKVIIDEPSRTIRVLFSDVKLEDR